MTPEGYVRVTEAIKAAGLGPDYTGVPAEILERARVRGEAIHLAIQLHEEGDLDEASLHPDVRRGLDIYIAFKRESGYQPFAIEPEIASERWGCVGHPDSIGWIGTERTLLDFKAVAQLDLDYVDLQTAGYEVLWTEKNPTEPIAKRFALHLRKDGRYAFEPLKRSDTRQIFLACLVTWHERLRRKNGSSRYRDAA
jgi:hypothetical protein